MDTMDTLLIDQYVVVRCRDAGVHAGFLRQHSGRRAYLEESRRLWRWAPAKGAFLSGVAAHGLDHGKSVIGTPVKVLLTETCELLLCTPEAASSIASAPISHE